MIKMIGFVYMWENVVNGKKYIGLHKGPLDDGYIGSGVAFKASMKHYGIGNFKRTILYVEEISERRLYQKEFDIINAANAVSSRGFYNLTNFDPKYVKWQKGKKTRIISCETREKIRQARLGTKHTKETKALMSRQRKGKPSPTKGMKGLTSGIKNGNYGKKCYNNGEKCKFFVYGEQPRGWVLGKAPWHIKTGKDNPFFGKKHTEKSKEQMRRTKFENYKQKNNS